MENSERIGWLAGLTGVAGLGGVAALGAARNVGAFSIAHIAGEIELAKGPVTGRLVALERAAKQARFAITDALTE